MANVRCAGPDQSDCDNPTLNNKLCNGTAATQIMFEYTGDACEDSTNDQGGNFFCDPPNGPIPSNIVPLRIEWTPDGQTTKFFVGAIVPGEQLNVIGSQFDNIMIQIFDDTTNILLQNMIIQTACVPDATDESFNLGDKFGALTVLGFTNVDQGEVTTAVTLTYYYTLNNHGTSGALVDTFTTIIHGNFEDLLLDHPTNEIGVNEEFESERTVEITLTETTTSSTTYTTSVEAQGRNLLIPFLTCNASESITVTPTF